MTTRDRLLATATRLLAQHGYRGLGVSELLREADATAGSLYHHFPGGKEELAATAIRQAGEAGRAVMAALAEQLPLDEAVTVFFTTAGDGIAASEWQLGCPVGTPAADGVATSPDVAAAVAESLASWIDVLADALHDRGTPRARARELGEWAVAAYEGAVLVSRARRDAEVLRTAAREVGAVMLAATAPA